MPAPEPHSPSGERVLLVSPVRNEALHIEEVVRAVASQTRPPDRWIIVDDGSTDGTAEKLAALASTAGFIDVLATPHDYTIDRGDRNAAGGPDRAFNYGLELAGWRTFDYLGKLDGDIVLPPGYLEGLLARFRTDPELGMAAGAVTEWRGDRWWTMPTPEDHVTAPARLYRCDCFEAIGGMPPYLGADVITTTYAKLRGFRTRTFRELPVRHLRPMGSADGALKARRREGRYQYTVHYGLVWVLLRSAVVAVRFSPRGISGAAFLAGYLAAMLGRAPRVEDPEFRRFARREQRRRMRDQLRGLVSRRSR